MGKGSFSPRRSILSAKGGKGLLKPKFEKSVENSLRENKPTTKTLVTHNRSIEMSKTPLNHREPSTTVQGQKFDQSIVDAVWAKAFKEPMSVMFRRDICGAIIAKNGYANRADSYGWEVDHIIPVSQDGTDDVENLQPLHWENNQSKGEHYPVWECGRKK